MIPTQKSHFFNIYKYWELKTNETKFISIHLKIASVNKFAEVLSKITGK